MPYATLSLRPMQRAFVRHYVANGGNGTGAAKEAGYSPRSAGSIAYRLLRSPHVQKEIMAYEARREAREDIEAVVNRDWVLRKLVTIADRAMATVPVLDKDGNEVGVFKFNGTSATKAVELLGRAVGVFENSDGGKTGPQLNIQLVEYPAPRGLSLAPASSGEGPSAAAAAVEGPSDAPGDLAASQPPQPDITDLDPIDVSVEVPIDPDAG